MTKWQYFNFWHGLCFGRGMFVFNVDSRGYLKKRESSDLEYKENFHRGDEMLRGIRGRFLDPLFTCTLDVAQSCAKLQLAFAA